MSNPLPPERPGYTPLESALQTVVYYVAMAGLYLIMGGSILVGLNLAVRLVRYMWDTPL